MSNHPNRSKKPAHVMRSDDYLYIFSMGKRLRVTGIFTSDADANQHMQTHSEMAAVASFGQFVFLANKYDNGSAL